MTDESRGPVCTFQIRGLRRCVFLLLLPHWGKLRTQGGPEPPSTSVKRATLWVRKQLGSGPPGEQSHPTLQAPTSSHLERCHGLNVSPREAR